VSDAKGIRFAHTGSPIGVGDDGVLRCHPQRVTTVILNSIEDPFTSGFESLRNASELRQTSGV
jgi:hypothetical protein